MNITAKVVPFSSVVGSSVTLHDESGKVVCQLALLNTGTSGDAQEWKRRQTSIAEEIAARLNAPQPSAGLGSLMAAIETVQRELPEYADWAPAEDPAEIVTDLLEDLMQARSAQPSAALPGIEPWIERNFAGLGRAIRQADEGPYPDEPYMSMADAKALTRKAVEQFAALVSQPQPEGEAVDCCPICLVPFKPGDLCSTDIELGTCHAGCLEGSPTVSLETGEPTDGPIPTFHYAELAPPAPTLQGAGLIEAACEAFDDKLFSDDETTAHMAASPYTIEFARGRIRPRIEAALRAALSTQRGAGK